MASILNMGGIGLPHSGGLIFTSPLFCKENQSVRTITYTDTTVIGTRTQFSASPAELGIGFPFSVHVSMDCTSVSDLNSSHPVYVGYRNNHIITTEGITSMTYSVNITTAQHIEFDVPNGAVVIIGFGTGQATFENCVYSKI